MHIASSFTNTFFSGVGWVVYIIVLILVIAGLWKTFVKAGKPGWGAIIPIYNTYLMIKIAGRPGWWLILFFIPFVNIVMMLIVALGVSENFGHGAGYGILLWIFPWLMYLVLGFGDSQYKPIRT